MNARVSINRLSTGVPGFDEVLGGGLPEFSFNVIAGQPGCGKTTLAHQLMFGLATAGRSALYFTILGEPPLKMLRYQQQFAFFDEAAINRSITFVNLSEDALSGDAEKLLQRITDEVETHRPQLVFVDSFRAMVLSGLVERSSNSSLGDVIHRLSVLMTSLQATTFLLGEYAEESSANPVFTIADGLIWLRQSVLRNSMVRKMELIKMRGQPTLPGLHTFRISEAGIEVFAPAAAPPRQHSKIIASMGLNLLMGVPKLDDMLGDGLPRGYSLLVAGPSGSGKSVLAAAFLAEGVRSGETGVIAAFEQQPSPTRNPLVAQLINAGSVGLVDSRATDLSIDEVVVLLIKEIRRIKATRVVIDSLSGFELALAPTFREDFRESLARMIAAVEAEGVTMLMTSELEDRYTDLRFSPYGTAFLTDAIIVMRYIEVESRLRRVLAVVKVRGSAHSDELREFMIDSDGIHIGNALPDEEGLLGGSPTKQVAANRSATPKRRVIKQGRGT